MTYVKRSASAQTRPRIDRRLLAAKADALERTLRKLAALRDGLRHAAACPARDHFDCPTFRRYLRAAAAGAKNARRRRKSRAAA